jgi:hypothetical protein
MRESTTHRKFSYSSRNTIITNIYHKNPEEMSVILKAFIMMNKILAGYKRFLKIELWIQTFPMLR